MICKIPTRKIVYAKKSAFPTQKELIAEQDIIIKKEQVNDKYISDELRESRERIKKRRNIFLKKERIVKTREAVSRQIRQAI